MDGEGLGAPGRKKRVRESYPQIRSALTTGTHIGLTIGPLRIACCYSLSGLSAVPFMRNLRYRLCVVTHLNQGLSGTVYAWITWPFHRLTHRSPVPFMRAFYLLESRGTCEGDGIKISP